MNDPQERFWATHAVVRRTRPLPHPRVFWRRFLRNAAIASVIVGGSLGIGVLGYHLAEGLPWLDALVNASMILSGMGPVDPLRHTAGKWFAAFYALFSGVMFITTVGVLFAPVFHRFLHRFHLDIQEERQGDGTSPERHPERSEGASPLEN